MILTSKVLSIDIDPNQHIDLFSNKDKKYKELEKHVGCFYNGKHIKKIKSCTF